ncbi:MAG: leucine-rich repeat protein [Clostridiales bacterium]|nr:leucine-rich repeat protein [Clostridiales bacterium]
MKKILSVILSLVILVTTIGGFATTAQAATRSGTTGDLTWSLDTSTGIFTLSGTGYSANYTNSFTSTLPWYSYKSYIKYVVVEDGVVGLGDYLFNSCSSIKTIEIPDSVDTIGNGCFRKCTSLTSVTLPSGCSWFYSSIFYGCSALKWVIMPETNLTDDYAGTLPDSTFYACTSLEEVYIGSGITEINASAFYNCPSLKGVIWDSGEISSVGTNAFYNVTSSCAFIDNDDSLADWASTNGFTYYNLTDTCSDNTYSSSQLTYDFDFLTGLLSFSGSGDMSSTPWQSFHYFIKNITFADVDNTYTISESAFADCVYLETVVFNSSSEGELHIYPYAFSGCTATTYWLNLPSNVRYIDDYAFYNTNFNYVTIASEDVTIGTEAFGDGSGSYARFFGMHDSGARAYVQSGQSSGYDWHYYCLNDDHDYLKTTVDPTCTTQGYDIYECQYCDVDQIITNYVDMTGHTYKYTGSDGSNLIYTCTVCGQNDLELDAVMVQNQYINAISHDNDYQPYNQSNYVSYVDVYTDGYINAKDFLIIGDAISNISTTNKLTTVDETTTYQTIEGFGASAAWWSQDVGGWDNIDEIMSLLYSEEDGIGLNIYRYNLGAGSEDDTAISDWRRRAEDFLSSDSDIDDASTYDWDADVNARTALASAQKANENLKVTLFSNSAPVSLTDNGKAYCTYGTTSNLSEENYQSFATYLVNCAEHFVDEGYNVTSISPINEPEWSWAADEAGTYCSQEGCHWDYDSALSFYNDYMIPTIQNSSLSGTTDISIWESGQMNYSYNYTSSSGIISTTKTEYVWNTFMDKFFSSDSSYSSSNANIRDYVDSVDTHSYWASTSDRETVASQLTDSDYSSVEKVRCTEYCQMTNDGSSGVYDLIQEEGTTNGMTIAYGLALADIIYQDLTILNAVEWDWWTACSAGIYPDGLVYINYDDHSVVQASKRLWCMGNYSKFIDEGAVRVEVSTESGIDSSVEQSAYVNPDGSVVIVYINQGDTIQYTAFNNSEYTSFKTYVTDETHDLELYQSGNSINSTSVAIPAQSVTTVVINK